ncbi:MAG: rhomboid family intramembrane serine protease [Acidobacteria bacterium]|nr:rhomboid family intramembrane serine protease [Acidobacteriota bacterium]
MIPLRDSQPSRTIPAVTVMIIAINVAVFLFELSLPDVYRNFFVERYGIVPEHVDPKAIITSMFLHAGWLHLIGNMWFLWIFGDNIEDILGAWKYVLFYLLCGAAAAFMHIVTNADSRVPTVGASGAIAGVMGAYMVKFPESRIRTLIFIVIFIQVIEIRALWLLIYWLGLQVFSGVADVARQDPNQGGVAWFAHVGGFLAGMGLILLLRTRDRFLRYDEYYW